MPRIHKHIDIKVPVRKVFSYIENPMNDPDWIPSMIEVKDVNGSGAGTNFKWSWKMAGLRFNGESTFVEDIPDKELVVKSKGGIEATWTFKLEPHKDATSLDLDIDYSVPVPVLGKLAEKLILKRNEREADMGLMNLKERLEVE
jgi:uncharacterized membrane protein